MKHFAVDAIYGTAMPF